MIDDFLWGTFIASGALLTMNAAVVTLVDVFENLVTKKPHYVIIEASSNSPTDSINESSKSSNPSKQDDLASCVNCGRVLPVTQVRE